MSRPWTTEEVRFLQENKARGLNICAAELGRPYSSVKNVSTKLFRREHPLSFRGFRAGRATA